MVYQTEKNLHTHSEMTIWVYRRKIMPYTHQHRVREGMTGEKAVKYPKYRVNMGITRKKQAKYPKHSNRVGIPDKKEFPYPQLGNHMGIMRRNHPSYPFPQRKPIPCTSSVHVIQVKGILSAYPGGLFCLSDRIA